MRAIGAACLIAGSIVLGGCETMDSIGDSVGDTLGALGDLVPTGSKPAPAEPLWVQETAGIGALAGAECTTRTGSCPLDVPQQEGAQCTCAMAGGVSLGIVTTAAQ